MAGDYREFLARKSQLGQGDGFDPVWMPDFLFDFQRHLVGWAIRRGRAAIFADCLAGDSLVHSPDGDVEIAAACERGDPFRVYAIRSGKVVVTNASCPWINGVSRLYRFTFTSGRTITATLGHRFLAAGGWKRGESLEIGERLAVSAPSRLRSTLGFFRPVFRADGRHSTKTTQDYQDHCLRGPHRRDEQLPLEASIGLALSPSQADALSHTQPHWQMDARASISVHNHHYQIDGRPSIGHFAPQVATIEATSGFRLPSCDPSYSRVNNHIYQPAGEATNHQRRASESHPSAEQLNEGDHFRAFQPCGDSLIEWDTLAAVDYIRTDVFYDIEVPGAENFLANEIWSHNCGLGKTPMQLVWAENVVRKTNKPVLIMTPLAVSHQTEREAEKFSIEANRSSDGKHNGGIVITNYERLHYFNAADFVAVVCDESSILKSFQGATRKQITRFMSKMSYRLLCTATAAPNDYVELGTSAEALGELSHSEMLRRFFRQLDDKGQKRELREQERAERLIEADPNYYRKLAYRVSQTIGQWRLKHHAVEHFWRWIASWAKAIRMPSDLGYDDNGFQLPGLVEREHIITPNTPPPGMLFNLPAVGMSEERGERRRTLMERCEFVAQLVSHGRPAVVWCQMNPEGDLLEKLIPDGLQIAGRTPDEQKINRYEAFADGSLRVLIIKPKIGAWGLNWQHCSHVVTFPSHSYEQYYQSVRRCYRFGQQQTVTVDVVATDGELRAVGNMRRKADKASAMFDALLREMTQATTIKRDDPYSNPVEVPAWL